MKVVKQYKLTLYRDGYMTDKRSQRIIKAMTFYSTKPTEVDIEAFIQDQVDKGYVGSLRELNIEVKKEYKIEI